MAVAFGNSTNLASSSGTQSFNHTPSGTPRGVIVIISGGALGATSGVTYGGVALTQEVIAENAGGETGTTSIWFLGSGISTGTQSVQITRSAADNYIATCITVTANADTAVTDFDTVVSTSTSNVNTSLTIPAGVTSFIAGGIYSGENALGSVTDNAAMTRLHSVDFGNFVSVISRRTNVASGATTVTDFTYTQSADDAACAVIAIQEISPPKTAHAQAQARIKSTARGVAQAQANIKNTYTGHAQAQSRIKQTYQGYGQAQAAIDGFRYAKDTFSRADGSIGTAEAGGTYSTPLTGHPTDQDEGPWAPTTLNIVSQELPVAATGAFKFTALREVYLTNLDMQVDVKFNAPVVGGSHHVRLMGRLSSQSPTVALGGEFILNDDVTEIVPALNLVYGKPTLASDLIVPLDGIIEWAVDTWYTLRFQAINIQDSGTPKILVRTKVWFKGTAEPDWQHSHLWTPTNSAVLAGGGVGLTTINATDAEVISTFDNFIAQTYIPAGFGQAQANIKQTYTQSAQAQASIKATARGFGQANASIKTTSNAYGQAQGIINGGKIVYDTFTRTVADGWGNPDIGGSWDISSGATSFDVDSGVGTIQLASGGRNAIIDETLFDSFEVVSSFKISALPNSQTYLLSIGRVGAGINVRISSTGLTEIFGFVPNAGGTPTEVINPISVDTFYTIKAALARRAVSNNVTLQVSAKIWETGTTEPANWQIEQVLVNTHSIIPTSFNISVFHLFTNTVRTSIDEISAYELLGVGQAQALIKNTYFGLGQAQASIQGEATTQHAQAQATIKATYNAFAQAQANILATSNGYGQAQGLIKNTYSSHGQAQGNIKNTYNGHGQSQANILAVSNGFGQAQGNIKATYQGHAQAQSSIKNTYDGYAQAQANILNTYQGFAQAQANIKATYTALAQAQANILATSNAYGQAQANIKNTYDSFGQAQGLILQTYNIFAQAQALIKNTYNGYGQAQSDILATSNGYGQAQGLIKNTYSGHGQTQANILNTYQGYGQAQGNIKQTYQAYAQAQGKINAFDICAFGQANALITGAEQRFAQAQAWIKTIYNGHGQAQGSIKAVYVAVGQAQALITTANAVHGQAQALIKSTYNQHAQAQATILATNSAHGQAQGNIKQVYSNHANAQAWIETTINSYAQAQGLIKQIYQGYAQAQSLIQGSGLAWAQAQSWIKSTINAYGQAQANILKLAGYGQAQAFIRQDRVLKNLEISDVHSITLEMSDRKSNTVEQSDQSSITLALSDDSSITLSLDDTNIMLEISDSSY